ncbi:hypothetical protein RRG08_023562 [Elysia crispata]|uniref:PiggyBac transposable element-derived protein domain-containing protein n=1 Tax=Elysia crispata TaxID=231223 RepID=A0AAE1DBX7_9GAST|nr:hypothetical protein RRG08_023562 [Elysia crispata]
MRLDPGQYECLYLKAMGSPVEELFSGCHSPGQYFTTFFDNSIVDDLIFQTTLYITQQERRVSTVTRQDILGFIGINIITVEWELHFNPTCLPLLLKIECAWYCQTLISTRHPI